MRVSDFWGGQLMLRSGCQGAQERVPAGGSLPGHGFEGKPVRGCRGGRMPVMHSAAADVQIGAVRDAVHAVTCVRVAVVECPQCGQARRTAAGAVALVRNTSRLQQVVVKDCRGRLCSSASLSVRA